MLKGFLIAGGLTLALTATGASGAMQPAAPRSVTLEQLAATRAPALRGYLVGLRGQCGGAAPNAARGAIQTADINGDGLDDFLINNAGIGCGGRAALGAGGHVLFRSEGGDYRRDDIAGRTVQLAWNEAGWLVLTDGRTWQDPMGPSQPPPVPIVAEPGVQPGGQAEVIRLTQASSTDFRRSRAAAFYFEELGNNCSGASAITMQDGAVSMADVDGDGRNDFLVDRSRMRCSGYPMDEAEGGHRAYDVLFARGSGLEYGFSFSGDGDLLARHEGRTLVRIWDGQRRQWWTWDGRDFVQAIGPDGAAPHVARLPVTEGRYAPVGDPYGSHITLTGSRFISDNEADSDDCRIVNSVASGASLRLSLECRDSCGNGGSFYCPVSYYPVDRTVTVSGGSRGRMTIAGGDYWNGTYQYEGPAGR